MSNDDHSPSRAPSGRPEEPAGAASGMTRKALASLASLGTFHSDAAAPGKTPDQLAQHRTTLAVHRTLMAADRSLMAWVRTALSMISFGFTIYKVLQGFIESGAAVGEAAQPRVVGLFLIGVGNISILMGIVEYWHRARELSIYEAVPVWRPSFVIAVLIAILSALVLVGVVSRML